MTEVFIIEDALRRAKETRRRDEGRQLPMPFPEEDVEDRTEPDRHGGTVIMIDM